MNEPLEAGVLDKLRQLAEIDSSKGRILAEKERSTREIAQKKDIAKKLYLESEDAKKTLDSLKAQYDEENEWVKSEREKIKGRKKSLSTFTNFKVQQDIQKEINRVEKLVDVREESILLMLDQLEQSSKKHSELFEKFDKLRSEIVEAQDSMQEIFSAFEKRYQEKESLRSSIVATIPKDIFLTYENVRNRHQIDPVAPIVNGRCGACNTQTPPQDIVLLSSEQKLIRCRGCMRILYIEKAREE
jgi:predicted  nucleic acid-binding Zn-ribbon protein